MENIILNINGQNIELNTLTEKINSKKIDIQTKKAVLENELRALKLRLNIINTPTLKNIVDRLMAIEAKTVQQQQIPQPAQPTPPTQSDNRNVSEELESISIELEELKKRYLANFENLLKTSDILLETNNENNRQL